MKAVLVIDMPEVCYDCPCYFDDLEMCKKHRKRANAMEKPSWCPLKPLPSTRNDDMEERGFNIGMFNYGWNECIKEIEK